MTPGKNNDPRRIAAFDIDGTIIRWQLYHALADEMARQGLLNADQFQNVRAARMGWKNRTNPDAFRAYEKTLVALIDVAIADIKVEDLIKACQKVIQEYKAQVYTYTRDLITELKKQEYLLFAISASQAQIVGMIASYYGFDDFGGSEYEVKDGYFTGNKNLLISERKPEYLKELVTKHNATFKDSIAVGDSEGDIPMLSIVEQPIAFNPNQKLFNHAQSHHWKIVVERKNMVYELEPKDGSYVLA